MATAHDDTRSDVAASSQRPEWLTEDEYPFNVGYLGTDDERIAYVDEGTGPTLVFVHVGLWSFVWRDVIVGLRDSYRCIAIDAPATGLSGGAPTDATLTRAADSVHRVVMHLDLDDLILVLHDLGGPAALLAARRWPDKVTGIVAVNTFGWRPSGAAFRAMLAVMGSAPMRWFDVATGFLPRMTSGRFGVGRHLTRTERRLFRRGVGRRGRASFHRYMASARHTDFEPVETSLDALATRPILTIFGARNDPLGFQPRWAERCRSVRHESVPRGNHFPMCDAPDVVATAIRAWQQGSVAPQL